MPQAILTIDDLGIEVPIFAGTDKVALNRGAGHVTGTPEPGEPGNVAIAGHRDGFFRPLKDIEVGDDMVTCAPSPERRITRYRRF